MSRRVTRHRALRWTVVVSSAFLTPVTLVPGCKFTSCADTNSCNPEENEPSMGGQGGDSGASGMGGSKPGALDCEGSEIECEGSCVDPDSNSEFCGASGSCEGANAGLECASDEFCVEGACQLDCPEGQVGCDGACIDPNSEDAFCGADAACGGYEECAESEQCIAGACAGWGRARVLDMGEALEDTAPAIVRLGIDEGGAGLAVWSRMSPSSTRDLVTSMLLPEAQDWSVPVVRDVFPGTATVNDVHLRTDGRAEVTYTQAPPAAGAPQMIWNVSRAQSGDWSEPSNLLGEGGIVGTSARIHIEEGGDSLGAWIHESGDDDFVRFRYRPEGEAWAEAVDLEIDAVAPMTISSLHITPITESELGLAFRVNDGSGERVFWSKGTEGAFDVAEELPFNLSGDVAFLTASGNENGTVAVAVRDVESAESATIRVAVFRGGEWVELAPVPTSEGALHGQLGVAVGQDGVVTALWVESESAISLWSIMLPSGADEWQEPARIAGPTDSISDSTLANDGLGNVQVAWIQEASGNLSVWGARKRAGETAWRTPVLLEDLEEDAIRVALAFNNPGQGIVTWWSTNPSDHLLGYNTFR